MNMENHITVKFFTVDRHIPDMKCDSVRVPVSDNSKGEFSGSYGIKKGHARSVFSLKAGEVIVTAGGEELFLANISDGFAIVENNEVRITVDKIED